jgi:hypothetical protein
MTKDRALTKADLWFGMHLAFHPGCPYRDASLVNPDRPVTECAIDVKARPMPPALSGPTQLVDSPRLPADPEKGHDDENISNRTGAPHA